MKTKIGKAKRSVKALHLATMIAILAVATMVGGCVVPHPGHVHGSARVRIESGHICTGDCGHYHHRRHWYHQAGHVHGPGCGHVMRGGIWVVLP